MACAPGEFQSDEGQSSCSVCTPGLFQGKAGQSKCDECSANSRHEYCGANSHKPELVSDGYYTVSIRDKADASRLLDEAMVGNLANTEDAKYEIGDGLRTAQVVA